MKDDLKSKYAPIHQHCVKWLQELKELRKTVKNPDENGYIRVKGNLF